MTSFSQRCSDAGLSAVSLILQAIADGRDPGEERISEAVKEISRNNQIADQACMLLLRCRVGKLSQRDANHYCLFDYPPRPLDEPAPETLRGADDVIRGAK